MTLLIPQRTGPLMLPHLPLCPRKLGYIQGHYSSGNKQTHGLLSH